MTKILSRGPQLDTELCVRNAGGNKFNLIIMAAARAREMARQHRNSGSTEHFSAAVSALLEYNNKPVGNHLKRMK